MINENRKHIFENLEGSRIEGGKENRNMALERRTNFRKKDYVK